MRTPSGVVPASSSSTSANVANPSASSSARRPATGSTTPTTSICGELRSAPRCTLPIRPAPMSARRTGAPSETMRAQVLAVAALVGGGLVGMVGVGQHILLDHEPALIPDSVKLGEDRKSDV